MNQKDTKRITPLRIIAVILVSLLPMALLLLCGVMLLGGAILNISLACCFVLLPLLVIALSRLTVFSRKSTPAKWGIILLIYLIAVPLFLFGAFTGRFELVVDMVGEELTEEYTAQEEENPFLPPMEEIGDPAGVVLYEYFATQAIFFTQDVYALIARYEPEEYALQKQTIESKYEFQTEPMSYREHICEPAADMDGYLFRMIDSPDVDYPQTLGFIATNDETMEIVYMSFKDYDLDWIDNLPEFLNEDCGWEHIR